MSVCIDHHHKGRPGSAHDQYDVELPNVNNDDSLRQAISKLSNYFNEVIELPSTFEQLRTTSAGNCLRVLVNHLASSCTNQVIVCALLALRWHYSSNAEQQSVASARSDACEIVAWRLLTRFSEREALSYCLFEIPETPDLGTGQTPTTLEDDPEVGETTSLLARTQSNRPAGSTRKRAAMLNSLSFAANSPANGAIEDDSSDHFEGLNALEVAAVANAKRFLSQPVVQKIVTGIWNGNIVYWDSLSAGATKQPRFFDRKTADPYSRLRVPKYQTCWEVLFFAVFLCLFYTVLIRRETSHVTKTEFALYCWYIAFIIDEVSEFGDAGSVFYATDIWNFFDVSMIFIGIVFGILRIIGFLPGNEWLRGWAFDILALVALFMVPRICSFMSLSPYWGTLVPALKDMGVEFFRFMAIVVITYVGFLTTFSLIGRDAYNFSKMTGILARIFYGSSYIGFEVMNEIDPVFGPPLMVVFITLTNFLLLGSLTSILSESYARVTAHAREEYLYVYSVYVLEASISKRLTHFYPPFNLLDFILFKSWRLFTSDEPSAARAGRIWLLRITHSPIVLLIMAYEHVRRHIFEEEFAGFSGPNESKVRNGRPSMPQERSLSAHTSLALPAADQGLSFKRKKQMREDDIDGEHTNLDEQISELNHKVEQLMTIILAMQETTKQAKSEGKKSVSEEEE